MRGGEQILAAILRGQVPLPRPFLRGKVLLLSELYIYIYMKVGKIAQRGNPLPRDPLESE